MTNGFAKFYFGEPLFRIFESILDVWIDVMIFLKWYPCELKRIHYTVNDANFFERIRILIPRFNF